MSIDINHMYALVRTLVLTDSEKTFLASLPETAPAMRLTDEQKAEVNALYNRRLGAITADHKDLFKLEQNERWPGGGGRVNEYQAKLRVLERLKDLKPTLDDATAAKLFFLALDSQRSWMVLLMNGYVPVALPVAQAA